MPQTPARRPDRGPVGTLGVAAVRGFVAGIGWLTTDHADELLLSLHHEHGHANSELEAELWNGYGTESRYDALRAAVPLLDQHRPSWRVQMEMAA